MASLPFDVEPIDGQGLTITSVSLPRDARKAGLKMRDIVTGIDGEPVREIYDLARIMSRRTPGQSATLSILRRGEHFDVTLELVQAR